MRFARPKSAKKIDDTARRTPDQSAFENALDDATNNAPAVAKANTPRAPEFSEASHESQAAFAAITSQPTPSACEPFMAV
jgi:hypothetical protein